MGFRHKADCVRSDNSSPADFSKNLYTCNWCFSWWVPVANVDARTLYRVAKSETILPFLDAQPTSPENQNSATQRRRYRYEGALRGFAASTSK